jgi:hypothetical protein
VTSRACLLQFHSFLSCPNPTSLPSIHPLHRLPSSDSGLQTCRIPRSSIQTTPSIQQNPSLLIILTHCSAIAIIRPAVVDPTIIWPTPFLQRGTFYSSVPLWPLTTDGPGLAFSSSLYLAPPLVLREHHTLIFCRILFRSLVDHLKSSTSLLPVCRQ